MTESLSGLWEYSANHICLASWILFNKASLSSGIKIKQGCHSHLGNRSHTHTRYLKTSSVSMHDFQNWRTHQSRHARNKTKWITVQSFCTSCIVTTHTSQSCGYVHMDALSQLTISHDLGHFNTWDAPLAGVNLGAFFAGRSPRVFGLQQSCLWTFSAQKHDELAAFHTHGKRMTGCTLIPFSYTCLPQIKMT